MHQGFTPEEWEQLSNYRITSQKENHASHPSVILGELMDSTLLHKFFHEVSKRIGSPTLRVTASMILKRIAFLAAAYMYALTAYNKRIDLTLDEIMLITNEDDPLWLPNFHFTQLTIHEPGSDRDKWREEAFQSFFGKIIHPVIEQIELESKQSNLVLWENIAIYLYWLYESNLLVAEDKAIQSRAKEDFAYLTSGAPASIFGPYLVNPIQRHYHEKQFVPHLNEEVRVRTTCCFFYKLTNTSDRCKICPQTCKPNLTTKRGGKILEREVKRAVGRTAQ